MKLVYCQSIRKFIINNAFTRNNYNDISLIIHAMRNLLMRIFHSVILKEAQNTPEKNVQIDYIRST